MKCRNHSEALFLHDHGVSLVHLSDRPIHVNVALSAVGTELATPCGAAERPVRFTGTAGDIAHPPLDVVLGHRGATVEAAAVRQTDGTSDTAKVGVGGVHDTSFFRDQVGSHSLEAFGY